MDKNFDIIKKYVDKFNKYDEESYVNMIDNAHAYEWMCEEIPVFECPDKDIEETYYFRWWTYRKHIKNTEEGFIITEFLPKVPWSGRYNEINAAVGHHIYEGRWLKNSEKYLENYTNYFLNNSERGHQYSAWIIYAIYQKCLVNGNRNINEEFLKKICRYYEEWEEKHLMQNGMFWSYDDRDAMEYTISGTTEDVRCLKGIRPTLNSYMCADAFAISYFARCIGNRELEKKYYNKHTELKNLINDKLWQNSFYRAFHFEDETNGLIDDIIINWIEKAPMELVGYIPWMFNIPETGREYVFDHLLEPKFFYTKYGITTVEICDKRFLYKAEHECLWNGYIWPFATSQTLTAVRNVIINYGNCEYKNLFYKLLKQYAKSHRRITEAGVTIPWIDEVRHPLKDEWSSREILKGLGWKSKLGGYERGKDYNHSTFCDLVISGLVGVKYENEILEVIPSVPEEWEYFKLDNLHIRGNTYSIIFDKNGEKYKNGKGLTVTMKRGLTNGTEF